MAKKLALTALTLLLVSACGSSGNNGNGTPPSGPAPVNGWTAAQVTTNMQGCVSNLQGLPYGISSSQITSICTCWVGDVENNFTAAQADLDSNVPQVKTYLNQCAQSAGIQTPLAFSLQKIKSMLFGGK